MISVVRRGLLGYKMNTFDAALGEKLKKKGMAAAAKKRRGELLIARRVAVLLAQQSPDKTVTADDVQRELIKHGIQLGNAAGSIFKEDHWEFTGKFTKSERAQRHSNSLRIWRLKS